MPPAAPDPLPDVLQLPLPSFEPLVVPLALPPFAAPLLLVEPLLFVPPVPALEPVLEPELAFDPEPLAPPLPLPEEACAIADVAMPMDSADTASIFKNTFFLLGLNHERPTSGPCPCSRMGIINL